jgi:hypothetical protein
MIPLKAWVHITHRFAVQSPTALAALRPFHIWSEQFIVDRLQWRPHQPLQVLCVRTYRLPEPILLRRFPHHRGCRSWVNLDEPIISNPGKKLSLGISRLPPMKMGQSSNNIKSG